MSEWDDALEAAARAVEVETGNEGLATLIRGMKGEEQKAALLKAMEDDDLEAEEAVERGIFTNVELGLMRDNGNGTYSLTEKGLKHVEGLLASGGETEGLDPKGDGPAPEGGDAQ